jgi:hypothetical protein
MDTKQSDHGTTMEQAASASSMSSPSVVDPGEAMSDANDDNGLRQVHVPSSRNAVVLSGIIWIAATVTRNGQASH